MQDIEILQGLKFVGYQKEDAIMILKQVHKELDIQELGLRSEENGTVDTIRRNPMGSLMETSSQESKPELFERVNKICHIDEVQNGKT
jgi:hypothetical protein